jgi:hypothetical protein
VVFLGENKVGLHLHDAPSEKRNIAGYCTKVKNLGAGGPPAEPATQEQPSETTETPAQEEKFEVSGQIIASRNLDEFRSAAPTELGGPDFRSITLFKLISSIAAARTALALTVLHKGEQFCFRFNDKGNLVQFVGPGVGEDLLDRLMEARVITRHVRQEILSELTPKKFAEAVLLERKVVKLADLWAKVRDQVIDKFEDIRSVSGASYRIDLINTGRRTGVTFGSLIIPWMECALEDLGPGQHEKLLEQIWEKYPMVRENPTWPIGSFATGTKGGRFLDEYLNGNRTLTDAIEIYPLTARDKALRMVVILRAIDVLAVHDRAVEADEDADPETFLAREYEELTKKDMFAQAGLHWSSHVNDFNDAFTKLDRKYGPTSKLAGLSDETARLCKSRLDMAKQAMSFLKDRANRTKHRKEVVGIYQMKNSADLLYKQALLHLLKQDVRKARQLLETAIELDPLPEYITKLNSI